MKEVLQELREIKHLLKLQKKMLTLEEFCAYAGISKSHAYHLLSAGKVKYSKPFGGRVFFDIDDVLECLKQNPRNDEKRMKAKLNKHLYK
jgi:excisionase family DNA binding protein